VGSLTLSLHREAEQDRISVEGRVVKKTYRGMTEADGLYTWATDFGFWVRPHTFSARKVRWVHHFLS
jgi:hypothetical protein